MPNYPMDFNIKLDWAEGGKHALTSPPRPEIIGGAPLEFDGTDDVWSPEHMLLSSVSLCLLMTFEALAERANIRLDGYRCQTDGTVDKSSGHAAFSEIRLRVEVRSSEREKAEALLQTAKKYCLITNSLKARVTVEAAAPAR